MSQKIERDHQRFRKIVRGKVKSNLSKYITRGEMIGKKGRDLVSIPNADRNGVDVVASVGSASDVAGAFDLVLANVGAGSVLAMASELAARCGPGGRVVVAGLYADRADEVAAGFDAVGLTEEDRTITDGWACLIHHSPLSIQHTVAAASGDDRDTEGAR